MNIDNLTMVMGVISLVLAIVTPWINIFARKPKIDIIGDETVDEGSDNTDDSSNDKEELPAISIVITPHDNAYELEHNLPKFLGQDYPANFKVVVVASKGDSDDEDVLKRFSTDEHLYTTYIPDSSRYMSRKKLAITLGVKAAKTEWIVMTDIASVPDSDQWLKNIGRLCTDDKNLVLGYTRYDEGTADYRRFERLETDLYLIREAKKGIAYRCNSTCLAFRKSEFLKEEGFRGNLKYLRGEYDFMVNKYARPMSTAVMTDPSAWMTEEEPSDKEWRNKKLFYIEDRKHLERSASHRLPIIVDHLALHLNWLAIIAILVFGALTQRWILTGAAGLALIITYLQRTLIAKKAFNEWLTDIPSWKVVFFEVSMTWNYLGYKLKYAKADKNDFISHKL